MLFNKIISYLMGYLEILIRGAQVEKLINLATNSGLFLWDVRRLGPEVLYVKIRAHGYARMRSIARKSGCRMKIHHKKGWPFLRRKLVRRKMFIVGLAVFIIVLCYLSSLVLFIRVSGFEGPQKKKVIHSLHKLGFKPGITRKTLQQKKRMIEREMMIMVPEAVWFGITLRGVVAEVKVVPRKTAPAEAKASDIIAGYDGVITNVAVIRGVPVVKEGDTVARGDLLISGTQWYNDLDNNQVLKEEVAASGIIEARVWHEIEVYEPMIVWKSVREKRHYTRYRLRWGKRIVPLGEFGNPFEKQSRHNGLGQNYFWERHRKLLYQGRNPSQVVELIKDTWQEVTWRRIRRPLQEVKRVALAEAKRKQKFLMASPGGTEKVSWSEEGQFLKLVLINEKTQDIGIIAPR